MMIGGNFCQFTVCRIYQLPFTASTLNRCTSTIIWLCIYPQIIPSG
jgi:hypothetical protein